MCSCMYTFLCTRSLVLHFLHNEKVDVASFICVIVYLLFSGTWWCAGLHGCLTAGNLWITFTTLEFAFSPTVHTYRYRMCGLVMDWQPVQGVSCLSPPNVTWDRIRQTRDPRSYFCIGCRRQTWHDMTWQSLSPHPTQSRRPTHTDCSHCNH